MKRPAQNFILDIAIFVAFIALAATGLLMVVVLPPGSGHGTILWGLGRHGWGDIHFWIAMGLIAMVLVHLVLHWRWIVSMVKGRRFPDNRAQSRVMISLVALVALFGVAAAPFLTPTVAVEEERGDRQEARGEHEARPVGAITLGEIAYVTGVPMEYLVRELNLPDHISPGETLRRMQKRHGVDIEAVRRLINTYEASPSTLSLLDAERGEQPDSHQER